MSTWTLRYTPPGEDPEPVTRTLAEWGAVACSLELVNADEDRLNLQTAEPVDAEAQWAVDGTLELFETVGAADPVRRFYGTLVDPMATGEGQPEGDIERRRYTARGPWWWATQLGYAQAWRAFGTALDVQFPRVLLYYNAGTDDVLRDVAARIGAAGGPWSAGAVDARILPRAQKMQNLLCSQVIVESLKFMPDAVAWFDYTAEENPAFHCRRAADLDTISVEALTGSARSADGIAIGTTRAMSPRFVQITLKEQRPVDAEGNLVDPEDENAAPIDRFLTVPFQTALFPLGYDFAAPRAEFGGVTFGTDADEQFGVADAQQLCEQLYTAGQAITWRGEVTFTGPEPRCELRPGLRLNLTGGRAEWETMNALIQRVTHDVLSGRTTVSFEPPDHLAVPDLISVLRLLRGKQRPTAQEKAEQDAGESESWNFGDQEDDADPKKKKASERTPNTDVIIDLQKPDKTVEAHVIRIYARDRGLFEP